MSRNLSMAVLATAGFCSATLGAGTQGIGVVSADVGIDKVTTDAGTRRGFMPTKPGGLKLSVTNA